MKKIYFNFPFSGGVRQFSEKLQEKCSIYDDVEFYYLEAGWLKRLALFKFIFEREIWFSNNNVLIYFFLLLYPYKCNLILHDHKIRKGASKKEYLLIYLFRLFRWRFKNVIIHQKNDEDSQCLLNKRNVKYHYMPPHGYEVDVKLKIFEQRKASQKINLLCFGRVEEYKNFNYIADLVSELDNVELIIAGRGMSSERLEEYSHRENIKVIDGYIEDGDVPSLFENSDYLVLPYTSITQTTLIDLAGAYSKPVILSNIDSFKVYQELRHVLILDINSRLKSLELLKSLNEVNPEEYEIMSKSSHAFYLQSLKKWESYVEIIRT
ncbi:glycosyltransferase [Parasalinivibrio latis]|uniref:glycosyltransferase n=1 Tax=Parasalinivibrio latis TaxID=2952610 RepID=UPI0030E59A6D